jgi:hypothetical protein
VHPSSTSNHISSKKEEPADVSRKSVITDLFKQQSNKSSSSKESPTAPAAGTEKWEGVPGPSDLAVFCTMCTK